MSALKFKVALDSHVRDEPILRDFIIKDNYGCVISFDEKGFSMAVVDHLKNTPKLEHFTIE